MNHTDINGIIKLKACIAVFMGLSYKVEIDFLRGKAEYEILEGLYAEPAKETIYLIPEKMNKLIDNLKNMDMLNWQSRYENFNVLDGTSWVVEISIKGNNHLFEGSNAYPNQWDRFCKALEEALGKDFRQS